jgi:DNA-binding NarL/FixJ family response regulator
MYETGQHVQEILQAGASGYILKKASTRELVSAIQAVMQGEAFLCPSAAKQVLDEYTKQDTVTKQTKQNLLTNRELEVLNLVAEGKTSKEIADLLSISVRTVKTHRQHIMKKLDLHDRTELVRYAFRRGLIIP